MNSIGDMEEIVQKWLMWNRVKHFAGIFLLNIAGKLMDS